MGKNIDSKVFVQLDQIVVNQLVQGHRSLGILFCLVLRLFHLLLGNVVLLIEPVEVFSLTSKLLL